MCLFIVWVNHNNVLLKNKKQFSKFAFLILFDMSDLEEIHDMYTLLVLLLVIDFHY